MNFSDLKNDLSSYRENKIVFVGLGSRMRQDDSAGLLLTEKIQNSKSFSKSKFIFAETTPENFLNQILENGPALVVFIDSADWGGLAGEIYWIESKNIDDHEISTHTYSISLIEKFLKLEQNLDVKYLVVQPSSMVFDEPMSEEVRQEINQFFNI